MRSYRRTAHRRRAGGPVPRDTPRGTMDAVPRHARYRSSPTQAWTPAEVIRHRERSSGHPTADHRREWRRCRAALPGLRGRPCGGRRAARRRRPGAGNRLQRFERSRGRRRRLRLTGRRARSVRLSRSGSPDGATPRAGRHRGPAVLPGLAARTPGPRLLRLHPLPGCLSDHHRHRGQGPARGRLGDHGRLRQHRPRARHAGLAQGLGRVPARGLQGRDRDARPGPRQRRRLGRAVRTRRHHGQRRRVLDGPHRRRLCRRRGRSPARHVPLWHRGRDDDGRAPRRGRHDCRGRRRRPIVHAERLPDAACQPLRRRRRPPPRARRPQARGHRRRPRSCRSASRSSRARSGPVARVRSSSPCAAGPRDWPIRTWRLRSS